ncbi:uncharacterized protein LY89DRAFT_432315 [Mollisia scopiformis]|uniref:Uncharacterized protein n=1 Tax=Mollisia scopiformis TaxID=149040 RepID=A0A194XMN6_MOLSC|nr:uncharacterized protein LY89DRAFT_432315 [Mollisia scopiformis]KUJ21354.1 hypothetical protein LY89DRAFT_432315 [Mollisia scopiformis]
MTEPRIRDCLGAKMWVCQPCKSGILKTERYWDLVSGDFDLETLKEQSNLKPMLHTDGFRQPADEGHCTNSPLGCDIKSDVNASHLRFGECISADSVDVWDPQETFWQYVRLELKEEIYSPRSLRLFPNKARLQRKNLDPVLFKVPTSTVRSQSRKRNLEQTL